MSMVVQLTGLRDNSEKKLAVCLTPVVCMHGAVPADIFTSGTTMQGHEDVAP